MFFTHRYQTQHKYERENYDVDHFCGWKQQQKNLYETCERKDFVEQPTEWRRRGGVSHSVLNASKKKSNYFARSQFDSFKNVNKNANLQNFSHFVSMRMASIFHPTNTCQRTHDMYHIISLFFSHTLFTIRFFSVCLSCASFFVLLSENQREHRKSIVIMWCFSKNNPTRKSRCNDCL